MRKDTRMDTLRDLLVLAGVAAIVAGVAVGFGVAAALIVGGAAAIVLAWSMGD